MSEPNEQDAERASYEAGLIIKLTASEARCADLAAQVETLKPLARLGLNALDVAWDGCDYDGGEIQEDATAFRVLIVEERTETCGDACRCAKFAEDCGWLCYRESEATTKARAALAATAPKGDANEQAR